MLRKIDRQVEVEEVEAIGFFRAPFCSLNVPEIKPLQAFMHVLVTSNFRFRAHVQKVTGDAYWNHISNIFSFDTNAADPDEKAKKFWSFVKCLKKEFGLCT